jgi:hypothetical protein
MNNYFTKVPNIFTSETKNKMLELAFEDDAFMDNSYGISFYKHPKKLNILGINGDWQVQMLKQSVLSSAVHKDKDRMNEFDNIFMPRTTVISWPIYGSGETWFYDNNENVIQRVQYDNDGAILNTGGEFHNVMLTSDEPRIVFQLCFKDTYKNVVEKYSESIFSWSY